MGGTAAQHGARWGSIDTPWTGSRPVAATAPAPHPLSRELLEAVLADRTTDQSHRGHIQAAASWRDAFPVEPQFIAERPPSVALTRSIPKEHKQLLKAQLGFAGYRIGELYPRRTRRATAVNWLLAHLAQRGELLPPSGPLPPLLEVPAEPVVGHPGDLPVR